MSENMHCVVCGKHGPFHTVHTHPLPEEMNKEFESVHYRLNNQTMDENTEVFHNLLVVLYYLEKNVPNVCDFAIERISYCDSKTQVFNLKHGEFPDFIVILNPKDSQFTTAHEIAHAFLDHHGDEQLSVKNGKITRHDGKPSREDTADQLAIKWGFQPDKDQQEPT